MDKIMQKVSRAEKSICGKCSHRFVCRALDNQPCFECNQFTEEVVRCKDCKHSYTLSSGMTFCKKIFPLGATRDDDFCSYGERKDNGNL